MQLSSEDRAILAHVVIDPDAWVAHALNMLGEAAVKAKIERHRVDYLAQKTMPNYMNRAEREKAAVIISK